MNSQKHDQQDSHYETKDSVSLTKHCKGKKEMENLIKQPSAISIPYTIAPKIIRYLGINLTKEV